MGDYEKALAFYKQALLRYEKENNEMGVLFCLEKMGWLKREIGRYGEALELFRRAYPIGVRLNGDAAEIDADLGDVYMFSGDNKRAMQHYEKALQTHKDFIFPISYSWPPSKEKMSELIRKTKSIVHARSLLGMMHYFSKEYDKALQHLNQSEELIQRVLKEGKVHAVSNDTGVKELSDLIADYREAITSQQEELRGEVGEALFNVLIKPVKPMLKRMHSLPTSPNRFLVHDYAVAILPNASSLFFLDKEIAKDGNSILAVHGRYDSKHPMKSALLLAKDSINDGDLETFEIFSLNMNPKLVVLSACESGVGRVEGGDEVQGLNRAFMYAGAGGVVASLWNVADKSTYELMELFYISLKTEPPAEALREAQISLMKRYPSPYYWAPFYLTGGLMN
jgi:tetratricopeptide (TPR) repeat protein